MNNNVLQIVVLNVVSIPRKQVRRESEFILTRDVEAFKTRRRERTLGADDSTIPKEVIRNLLKINTERLFDSRK